MSLLAPGRIETILAYWFGCVVLLSTPSTVFRDFTAKNSHSVTPKKDPFIRSVSDRWLQ